MIYECTDRRGFIHQHTLSDELSAKKAMQLLGVYERPFLVRRYPNGCPDLVHTIQQFEVQERSDK